jgi:uncharacterized RDD family membrane protein YckC
MLDERQYTVETPEQIELAYDIAGIGSRFLAALVDHVIIATVLSFSCVTLSLVLDQLNVGIDSLLVISIFVMGIYLSICAYFIFFETTWNGQSPGKRLVGIRVVRTGGRPIGFLGSAIRNLIRLADFLPILYGAGMITMFVDRRARRLGDFAAGALTLREGRQVTLDMLSTPKPLAEPDVPGADEITIPNLQALAPADYEIVQEFLRQREGINHEIRRQMAGRLLEGLQTRLGYLVQGDAELFLLRLAAEYQALRRAESSTPVNLPQG